MEIASSKEFPINIQEWHKTRVILHSDKVEVFGQYSTGWEIFNVFEDEPEGVEIEEVDEIQPNTRIGLYTFKTSGAFDFIRIKPLEDLDYEEQFRDIRFDGPPITFEAEVSDDEKK